MDDSNLYVVVTGRTTSDAKYKLETDGLRALFGTSATHILSSD